MPSRERSPSPVWEAGPSPIEFDEEITSLNSKKIELVHAQAEVDNALRQVRDPYDSKHNWLMSDLKAIVERKKEEIKVMERAERKRREKERLEAVQAQLEQNRRNNELWSIEHDRLEEEEMKRRKEILQNGWWWQRMAVKRQNAAEKRG
jgi:hypothetical protein